MGDRSTPDGLGPMDAVRQGSLSADVRRRAAVEVNRSASQASLPLVGPPARMVELRGTDQPAPVGWGIVQTQREGGGAEGEGQARGKPGGSSASPPSVEEIAERVYQLLRRDLRLERERAGW